MAPPTKPSLNHIKHNWYDWGVENQPRIVCIGAASQDVFLTGKALTAKRDVRTKDYVEEFPLGAKLELDAVYFDTGGGASNAAATFARQGFKTSFAGKIGRDPAGADILRMFRREGISADLVAIDPKHSSAYSTLLLSPNGERTILSYRGASGHLDAKDFSIRNFEADWFYISSLGGNFKLLSRLLSHANNHGIQVALNPGKDEIAGARKLRHLLPLVTVLFGNKEELSALFGGSTSKEIIEKSRNVCPYLVLTDGPTGSFVSDNQYLYQAGQYQKVKVVDRTGAGDAFASGFTAALARGGSVEDALTLGSANSTSVVTKIGAKPGILRGHRLRKLRIKVSQL